MGRIALSAAIGMTLGLAGPALAENVQPQNPASVVTELQNAGLPTELTVDDNAPMINSSYEGTNFSVYLLNCTDKSDCRSIQFFAGYSDTGASFATLNEWNKTKRFARAYVDEAGDVWVEMDVDMDYGGISPELFQHNLAFWLRLMTDFETHVGYEHEDGIAP